MYIGLKANYLLFFFIFELLLNFHDSYSKTVARLGCRNWTVFALKREGWRKLWKDAEAHPGCREREREIRKIFQTSFSKTNQRRRFVSC
jgi:hypothetical protein